MTVLILAGERDLSADAMVRELDDRGVPMVRIDMAWFPQQLAMEAVFRSGRWQGRLNAPGQVVDLEGVRSVWYRAPSTFQFPSGMTPAVRQHAHNEAKLGVGGVLMSLPIPWINPPGDEADAGYKPMQLVTAVNCGLTVPNTQVTNDPEAVRRFVDGCGSSGAITKMLGAPALMEAGERRVAYTDLIRPGDLDNLAGIELTAHQFQQWAGPKLCEARVIVVGDRVFTVAIHAHSDATRVDWRRDYTALTYDTIDPPEQVVTGARTLVRRLGLVYAALDFVVTPEDWVFLEINAGGQFGWLDELAAVRERYGRVRPITGALADRLVEGAL